LFLSKKLLQEYSQSLRPSIQILSRESKKGYENLTPHTSRLTLRPQMSVDEEGLSSIEEEEAGSIHPNAPFDLESEALLLNDGRTKTRDLDRAAVQDRLLLPSLRFYFYQPFHWITSSFELKREENEAPKWTPSDSDAETTSTSTTEWITEKGSTEDLEHDRPVKKVTKRGRSRTRRERNQTNLAPSASKQGQERHLSWFAHGFVWTWIDIVFSWLGFVFAILARQSTSFVTLEIPMYVDNVFEPVGEVGMINLRLCYNQTTLKESDAMGCMILRLDSQEVNDERFQVSTILLSMVVLVGGFISIFFTTASFWSSINLRPIGIGCLFSFVLQSSSLLFFRSHLCAQHTCHLSTGCYFSICASVCWIVSCVASSRMDVFKRHTREKAKVSEGVNGIELQRVTRANPRTRPNEATRGLTRQNDDTSS
jgi:hypothetical protein